ncbi:MAG: 5-(carboxyamino)imidazole ribonucleotide mutase [Candidatus Diapherotrites archaeon]|nr:5-(carboxyamino)imidazole ribonucleotide mutase [Candidatus Diapherotrites archaeon]
MQITVILGSSSDAPIAEKCTKVLERFGVEHEVRVASAHRAPEIVKELVESSDSEVFIAIAGLAAALPGVVASHTTRPVIGVPVGVKLDGLDAFLSIAQMPPGIPVATVGIDRGDNAAVLAVEILAAKDDALRQKLGEYREEMKEKVKKQDEEMRK